MTQILKYANTQKHDFVFRGIEVFLFGNTKTSR